MSEYVVFMTSSCEQEDVLHCAMKYYKIPGDITNESYTYDMVGLHNQGMGNRGLYYPSSMLLVDYAVAIPALDDFLAHVDLDDIDYDPDYDYDFIAPYGSKLMGCKVFDFEVSNILLKVVVVNREEL